MVALLTGGVVLRQVLLVHTFRFFVDDAYIFFRYARSADAGQGLVFNPGQHVMAFSSPLYTLLLTMLGAVGGVSRLAGIANLLGLALFVVASMLLIRLARLGGVHPWIILPAWVLYFPFVSGAVNGMETMLFVALQLAALWLAVEDRQHLAAAALALLILTRPEGVLFAVALVAVVVMVGWRSRPPSLPALGLAAAAALLGGWAVFAWTYYGSVVPQSIVAKGAIHGTSGSVIDKLGVVAVGLSTHQFLLLGGHARDLVVVIGLGAGAFAVYCLIRHLRQRSIWAVMPAWFLLAWWFYAITDPIQIWSWYSVPTALALWWMVAREGPDLVARVAGRRAEVWVAGLATAVAAASFGLGVGKRQASLVQGAGALLALGQAVTRSVPGARTVMLDDIGIFGWSTGLVIIDSAGLASPVATRRIGGRLLSVTTLAEQTNPDVICLKSNPANGTPAPDPLLHRFVFDNPQQQIELLARYRVVPASFGDYRVFLVRRDLPPPPG